MEFFIYLFLVLLFATFSGVIAENKNRNSLIWALVGFFFGPFGLIVAVLPKLKSKKELELESRITSCKTCGEDIIFKSKVCKHCRVRYPYMNEPERSHIEAIEKAYVSVTTDVKEIVDRLNTSGPKCLIDEGVWTESSVKKIIENHIIS